MISLNASDPFAGTAVIDERVSRVLDVARFFYDKRNVDGTVTHFWELRKAVGVYPAGTVMTLTKLHELLFNR